MSDIAHSIVWAVWALVLGFTHWMQYLERKRLYRLIEAHRRILANHHDAALSEQSWRQAVIGFLGFLRETAPEPIRGMAGQLIPPNIDVKVTAVDAAGKPKEPVH